ncbi:uncharacterized protein LOC142167802 [Nicotiana tabacum]|uniref:Uncharacterized protein LOC142167802 n=1 Tax=Nicotiana tabacum TaxID=4097 RepID=A0AC58SFW7_TOBAC
MSPHKGTFKLIEKYIANIFWANTDDRNNYHWSSWNNLCVPMNEGGIGIRKMKDISNMLAIKRWWRIMSTSSLWTAYVTQKYCISSHTVTKLWASGISHARKHVVRNIAERHIISQINSGTCSFWWDNWSSKGHLAGLFPSTNMSSKTLVSEFIVDGKWNINKAKDYIPDHMIHHILNIEIRDQNKDDKAYWDLTDSDKFSNKTFGDYEEANFHLMALLLSLNNETMHHIFMEGKLKLPVMYGNQKKFSLYKLKQHVSWIVEAATNKVYPNYNLTMPWSRFCETLTRMHPIPRTTVVYWEKPVQGALKLNTDGSFNKEDGKAGLGGALRDNKGDIIMAFSFPYKCNNHNLAEAYATWFEVNWCTQNGFMTFTLELDSTLVT